MVSGTVSLKAEMFDKHGLTRLRLEDLSRLSLFLDDSLTAHVLFDPNGVAEAGQPAGQAVPSKQRNSGNGRAPIAPTCSAKHCLEDSTGLRSMESKTFWVGKKCPCRAFRAGWPPEVAARAQKVEFPGR